MSEVKTDSVVNVSGDNDSGIDLSTNDVVAIKTANSERMRVDSSGNVGIGMTPSRPLHVQASSGAASIYVRGRSSDGTATMLLHEDNSGNAQNSITGYTTHLRIDAGTTSDAGHTMQFYVNDSERMRIADSGNLFINTTNTTPNPGMNLGPSGGMAQGNSNGTSGFYFNYITRNGSLIGSITQSGTTGVAFNTSSDYRLKENVADMTGAITRVKALAPKRFNWVAEDDDRTVDGFLAHEAQAVVPEAVTGTKDEVDDDGNAVMQGIDQSKLVPLLTGALQEAIAKIETLETEMTALKARVTALENA